VGWLVVLPVASSGAEDEANAVIVFISTWNKKPGINLAVYLKCWDFGYWSFAAIIFS
jgi:hypothetical protein